MQAVRTDELELVEGWSETEEGMRVRVAFPCSLETGTKSTAVVYFELEPGRHLGRHTDSAEEVLYVVAGSGEATVGDERAPLGPGTIAVVPATVPHGVVNTGTETLRIVGFFSANTVVSVFDEPMAPMGVRVFTTPMLVEEPAAA